MAGRNGSNRVPRQQAQPPQGEPPIFFEVKVETNDGDHLHPYARHNVQLGPGDSSVLLVEEVRGAKCLFIYPLNRIKRVALTPTKLAAI